ncbi:unnamed protein product, partial [Mycena citricolor]
YFVLTTNIHPMNCELTIASQFKSWLMYLPTLLCDSVLVVQRSRFLLVKQQSLGLGFNTRRRPGFDSPPESFLM